MKTRKSQAFASFRQAMIIALSTKLINEIVPAFNAESENIRRVHDAEAQDPKIGAAVADHNKRAAIQDMAVRRNEFIESLQSEFKDQLMTRAVDEYEGELKEVEENEKKVQRVFFPDNSSAKMPKGLWIDYKLFQRV